MERLWSIVCVGGLDTSYNSQFEFGHHRGRRFIMDHLLSSLTPNKNLTFPPPNYLTPPDENQPLDFSAKKPRLSQEPPSPTTPILSIPSLHPRRLHQECPPSSSTPSLPLPSTPLPLTILQNNIKNSLKNLPLTPSAPSALQIPTAPSSIPPPISPFMFNPSFCFPSLLQMMSGQMPSPQPQLSPSPPTPPNTNVDNDKTELLKVNSESLGQYALFRQNMLRQLAEKKTFSRRDSSDSSETGAIGGNVGPGQQDSKDQAYWERRRKNNLAAKRSRDARRAKEDEIAIRAAFLEQENIQLKWEVARLKTETGRLRTMLLTDSDTEDNIDISSI